MSTITSKQLRISSDDRILSKSNSTTDFVIDLKNTSDFQNIKSLLVKSISFQNVMYNIRTGVNDTGTIELTGGLFRNFTLQEGFYNTSQMFSELVTKLDAATVADGVTWGANQIVVSDKILLASTGGQHKTVNSVLMNDILGFGDPAAVYQSVTTGENPINLSGLESAFLHSRKLSSLYTVASGLNLNILTEVPVTANFGQWNHILYNNEEASLIEYSTSKNFNEIDIRLRLLNGEIVDLHNRRVIIVIKCFY